MCLDGNVGQCDFNIHPLVLERAQTHKQLDYHSTHSRPWCTASHILSRPSSFSASQTLAQTSCQDHASRYWWNVRHRTRERTGNSLAYSFSCGNPFPTYDLLLVNYRRTRCEGRIFVLYLQIHIPGNQGMPPLYSQDRGCK